MESPWFAVVFTVMFFVVYFVSFKAISIFEEKKEEYIESLNEEDLLVYNLEEAEDDGYTINVKELVEEYVNENIADYEEMQKKFEAEDFTFIKDSYNKAIEELYFGGKYFDYSLETVIEDSKSRDDYTNNSVDYFLNIKRELLTTEIESKLFTEETEGIKERTEQYHSMAMEEINRESEERRIYKYMVNAYDQITNYGENYVPEIHDQQVAELASKYFGITLSEADDIYVKVAMRGGY